MSAPDRKDARRERREMLVALRNGALIGGAVLAVMLPLRHMMTPVQAAMPPSVQSAPAPSVRGSAAAPSAARAVAPAQPSAKPMRVALFGGERPPRDVREVANWTFYTGDHGERGVVVIDKRQAKAYVFDPSGELVGASPVLLGSAIGDDTVPGVGDKPIAEVKPEERTTPAGRFVAERGYSASAHEDVVWVDYDAAVSMHRVRPWVKAERRLERLASPTPKDNRISYGCINMPPAFYEQVLSPTVQQYGAIVYVLPERSTTAKVFGSYEIPNADVLALFAESRQVAHK